MLSQHGSDLPSVCAVIFLLYNIKHCRCVLSDDCCRFFYFYEGFMFVYRYLNVNGFSGNLPNIFNTLTSIRKLWGFPRQSVDINIVFTTGRDFWVRSCVSQCLPMHTRMTSTYRFSALFDQKRWVQVPHFQPIHRPTAQVFECPHQRGLHVSPKRQFGHPLWICSRSFDCVPSNGAETFHGINSRDPWMHRSGNSRAFKPCEK